MGGLVSQMQVTSLSKADWVQTAGAPMGKLIDSVPSDSLIHSALIYNSNPRIHRVVFICTPHRGSNMASGGIGHSPCV